MIEEEKVEAPKDGIREESKTGAAKPDAPAEVEEAEKVKEPKAEEIPEEAK